VFGAPGYLAPEVLARRDGGPDPDYYRADLFALGAVLYFAVYHRPPFGPTSDAHAQLTQRDRGPVYERRRADQSLGAINHICRACLYPDPALRYSLDDLIAGLDGFLFGGPIPRWREPWHRWVIRVHHSRPFRAVAVDLAVVLGIVAALGWTAYSRDLAQLAEQGIGVADGRVREAEGTFRPALISRAGNRRAWDEAEMARDEAARRVDRFDPVARWVWAGQSRQQVDQLTSIIHTGRSAAEADYALIENLDAILSAMIGRRTEDQNQAQLIDEFQTVLARHLDTYGVRLEDEDKLAEHVAGSRVWADLLAGIDALALLRKKVRPVDAEGWRRLLRAANRADPVVWRHDFRTLNLAGKAESDIRQHISGLRTVPPDEHPQLTVYLLFSLARDDESRAGLRAALLGLVDRHRADFWLNYALAMCSVKDRAEAIGYFRVARSKREDPILLANLAEALLAEGSSAGTAEGTEILRSLCLRPDASPEARNNFGVALMRANQLSQAKEQFSLAIAEMQRRYHRKFPAAFVNLASYHERAGENIVAAQLVTQVIEDPTASNECRALAYMIRATAQIRFHERSTVRGFTYLASDLPILPAVTGAPRIGLLLEGVTRQRLDRAEEDARLGVTLAPHLASPRQTLGWVLSYCGQRDKALDELLRATTLAPRDARVWYGLGEFYATHGYDAEALRVCHHCIVLDPNMWEPHFWCGKILCNRVDKPVHELRLDAWAALLPEARLHLRAAQRMAPESAEIAACLNVVYYVLGESHEAARQDLLARKLNQENPNLEQREAVNRVIRTVNTARRIDEIVRKYIAGDLDPRIDPDRYAAVAQLEGQRRYWIMSRVYHRLLQDNPRPIPRHLLEAARACALAADGEASDRPTPSNQERKSLQVELLFYGRRALDIFRSADNPANRSILRTLAQEWLSEWALAPYGSSGNLRRPLDADQRTAFEAFWREMARYAAPN
jgi:tetratricopeptide (TPR) repeat protein